MGMYSHELYVAQTSHFGFSVQFFHVACLPAKLCLYVLFDPEACLSQTASRFLLHDSGLLIFEPKLFSVVQQFCGADGSDEALQYSNTSSFQAILVHASDYHFMELANVGHIPARLR